MEKQSLTTLKASTKATIVRIGIPILRLLPISSALYCFASLSQWGPAPFITHAPPLQKVFYAPIAVFVWAGLALVPFILLRNSVVFRIYVTLLGACIAFLAYDYFVPFRYIAPDYHGEIQDPGGGYSSSGNNDHIDYWISYPTFPPNEDDWPLAIVRVAPLILAFVYRRYYPLWASPALANAPVNRPPHL